MSVAICSDWWNSLDVLKVASPPDSQPNFGPNRGAIRLAVCVLPSPGAESRGITVSFCTVWVLSTTPLFCTCCCG